MSKHPCYGILTAIEVARLYKIIHRTVLDYCGHNGKPSTHTLVMLYGRFLKWREDLPDAVRDVGGDPEALPHALFLQ